MITPSLYINGKWEPGHGSSFASRDPGNGKIVWENLSANEQDVEQAATAAEAVFPAWSALTPQERFAYIQRFKDTVLDAKEKLAEAISKEAGKPLWDAMNEVNVLINKIDLSFEAFKERCPEMTKPHIAGKSITRHKPHGVVAILGPFNFPTHLPNGQIVPALIAGNTIVFKPSELTPAVSELLIKLWEKANLPHGVLNMVQGGRETGQALVKNPKIKGIFFVGSFATGKWLSEQLASNPGKILALEMGGNNPLVIGDISDLKAAAYQTIMSAYLSAGQRCTCARRLIIPKGEKGNAFVKELTEMTKKITVGHYNSTPEPFMGPVISEKAAQKLLDAQASLKKRGGTPLLEMQILQPNTALLSPGLMDVTAVKDRPDEELFGPFLQLIWVNNLVEAIAEANKTEYGLTAGILSDSEEEYKQFLENVRAGLINWNSPITGNSSAMPFGGIGHSGNYRPSAFYAADYCSYPVASLENTKLSRPDKPAPGLSI